MAVIGIDWEKALLDAYTKPLGPQWNWNPDTIKSILIKMVVKGQEPADYFWEDIGE